MRYVDDAYIAAVAAGDDSSYRLVIVDDDHPHVGIDIFADAAASSRDIDRLETRYDELRKPFAALPPPELVVACGDLVSDADAFAQWLSLFADRRVLTVPGDRDVAAGRTEYDGFAAQLAGVERLDAAAPVVQTLRVQSTSGRDLAYVVVLGYDSNLGAPATGDPGRVIAEQQEAAEALVYALATGAARSLPLCVVGAVHHSPLGLDDVIASDEGVANAGAGSMLEPGEFLEHCGRLRMSLLVHGGMRRREIRRLSRAPLRKEPAEPGVPLAPAPTFRRGTSASGLARIVLDWERGQLRLSYAHDVALGRDDDRPLQVVQPIVSASRVTAGENRLRVRVKGWVAKCQADQRLPEPQRKTLEEFEHYIDKMWAERGIVALGLPDKQLPDLQTPRRVRYNILLLLRERQPGGGYDLLLSNHTPLKTSEYAHWNTLLAPAFNSVPDLGLRLRADVIRHVADQAEDLEKAAQARVFEDAVEKVLGDEDAWAGQLRELAKTTLVKVSPTNACLTAYEYRLVTLLPLIEAPDPNTKDKRKQAAAQMVHWLDQLPALRRRGEADAGRVTLPLDVVQDDAAGLRWVPRPDFGGIPGDERIPPGAIWFPLPGPDESHNVWLDCPTIVARNSDVMRWIDGVLRGARRTDGTFPPELVLGAGRPQGDDMRFVGQRPFSAAGDEMADGGVPPSTEAGLRRVRLNPQFDLEGTRPYEDQELVRVLLVKTVVTLLGHERPVIAVVRAEGYDGEPLGPPRKIPPDAILGLLRPVQRYVLVPGMERAARVIDEVLPLLDDKWGFALVRKGAAPRDVAVIPPIVEQVPTAERESDVYATEFLLCDGNHRVVSAVWNRGLALPAVAVLGEPQQPYYAHPFSQYEWALTAEAELDTTPDMAARYHTRRVSLDDPGVDVALLTSRPKEEWYRRYFRDFDSGFGYVGGQGGKWAG